MKKIIGFVFVFALLCSYHVNALAAQQRVGTKVGHIYYSDIIADIDGMKINSYNIGGETAVIAEDLTNYGFSVVWDAVNRSLTIHNEALPLKPPGYTAPKTKVPGSTAGNIYNTDITVSVNGYQINSYNLGGKTAIALEDLGEIIYPYMSVHWIGLTPGYSTYLCKAEWKPDARTISLNCLRPGMVIASDLGNMTIDAITPSVYYPGDNALITDNHTVTWKAYDPSFKLHTADDQVISYYDLNAMLKMNKLSFTYKDNTLNILGRSPASGDVEVQAVEPYNGSFYDNFLSVTLNIQIEGKPISPDAQGPACFIVAGKLYMNKSVFDQFININFQN